MKKYPNIFGGLIYLGRVALLGALAAWLAGCDTGRTVDIWQGTYKTGPRAFIDTDMQEFTADLTQGDERAVVKLKGYKSEAAEVLAVLLSQYTLAPRVEGDGQ